MKPARNMTKERMASVEIAATDVDRQLRDGRNAMNHGSISKACSQYGVEIKKNGRRAVLSAPRDRLQLIVEFLHYCSIQYAVKS